MAFHEGGGGLDICRIGLSGRSIPRSTFFQGLEVKMEPELVDQTAVELLSFVLLRVFEVSVQASNRLLAGLAGDLVNSGPSQVPTLGRLPRQPVWADLDAVLSRVHLAGLKRSDDHDHVQNLHLFEISINKFNNTAPSGLYDKKCN